MLLSEERKALVESKATTQATKLKSVSAQKTLMDVEKQVQNRTPSQLTGYFS